MASATDNASSGTHAGTVSTLVDHARRHNSPAGRPTRRLSIWLRAPDGSKPDRHEVLKSGPHSARANNEQDTGPRDGEREGE